LGRGGIESKLLADLLECTARQLLLDKVGYAAH
jgi:hypothetical protein